MLGVKIEREKSLAFQHVMRYFEFQGGFISFMFKGAIAIFAFFIILFSFAAQVTTQSPPAPAPSPQPVLLPDLAITDLSLTPQRKLMVTITNVGEVPLSLGAGNLKVFVDGALKGSYTLESLSGQSVLPIKRSITLTTPLTLIGRHEIDAQVDLARGVKELSEENNRLKKVLEGLPVGPDVVVKDLDLTEDLELVIVLCNAGDIDLRKASLLEFEFL